MGSRFDQIAKMTSSSGAIIPPPPADDEEQLVEEVPFEEAPKAEEEKVPAAVEAPVVASHPEQKKEMPSSDGYQANAKRERGRPRKKDLVFDNEGKRMKKTIIELNEDVHAYLEDRAALFHTNKKAYIEKLVLKDLEKNFEVWEKRVKEEKKLLEEAEM